MEVCLYKPEIPPNTGNIGRLCHCTQTGLHIIDKPAFSLEASAVKRAGLDYWDQLELSLHSNWQAFRDSLCADNNEKKQAKRILLFTRFAKTLYTEHSYQASDLLVFGTETQGLPKFIVDDIKTEATEHLLRIPVSKNCRSLNLSNTVAIILFEALRQQGFPNLENIVENDL